jgi:hypothetical protein
MNVNNMYSPAGFAGGGAGSNGISVDMLVAAAQAVMKNDADKVKSLINKVQASSNQNAQGGQGANAQGGQGANGQGSSTNTDSVLLQGAVTESNQHQSLFTAMIQGFGDTIKATSQATK